MREFRIAILFSGNGSNLENLLLHRDMIAKALAPRIQPQFVLGISNNPNAYGITRCGNFRIPCEIVPHTEFATRVAFEEKLAQILRAQNIDLIVLAGFMRILGRAFVEEFRAINIHPSLLPLHKGAHAIRDSFYGAEDFGGVSVHWVSEELDSGAIIAQEKVLKISGESMEDFERRIHEVEYKLYPQALISAIAQLDSSADSVISASMNASMNDNTP